MQVLTSIQLSDFEGEILLIASTQVLQQSGCSPSIQANIPLLDAYFTGTGVHICLSVCLLASFVKLVQQQHHCGRPACIAKCLATQNIALLHLVLQGIL